MTEDPDESPQVQLEREWWESAIRCFMSEGSEGSCQNRLSKFRLAAYYWALLLNTSLVNVVGRGLEAFGSKETLPAAAEMMTNDDDPAFLQRLQGMMSGPWRWIGVPMDQCSVGVCASNFLRGRLRLYMEPLYDPSHRVSNDLMWSIRASGFFPLLLAMKLCYSLNYGPWDGAKWWQEAKQPLSDSLKHFKAEIHPLYDALLPAIAHDIGELGRRHDRDWAEALFADLPTSRAVSSKGPRMALYRWMSWLHCSRYWDQVWHQRLFVLVLWGLGVGFVKCSPQAGGFRCERVWAAVDSHGNRSMTVQEKTARDLQKVGANTMHSVTLIYMEGWPLQRRVRLLMVVCTPLEEWYHKQHLANRDEHRRLAFYEENAGLGGLRPLYETLGALCSPKNLSFLGLVGSESGMPLSSLKNGSAEGIACDEGDFLAECMKLTFNVVGQRLRSLLWHIEGLPGVLPLLASESPHKVEGCLRYLRGLHEVVGAAQAQASEHAIVAKQVQQSFVSFPIPSFCLELLNGVGFGSVHGELVEAVRALFSVGQTVICEQANRVARNAETREQDNMRLAALRLWMLSYRQRVLSQVNCYQEVSHEGHTFQSAAMSPTNKVSKTRFDPAAHSVALPLRSLGSATKTPDFETTSPQNAARSFAHIAFWRYCMARGEGAWGQAGAAGMLVRRRSSSECYFVVAVVSAVAALAWKADRAEVGGQEVYFPTKRENEWPYEWLIVADPKEFMGFEVFWAGRAWQLVRTSSSSSSGSKAVQLPASAGPVAVPRGVAMELSAVSATSGFRNMSLHALKEFAALSSIDIPTSSDLFDVLLLLMKRFLPGRSDFEYEEMISTRNLDRGDIVCPDFFDSAEVRGAFGEQDQKFVDGWLKERRSEVSNGFAQKVAAFRSSALAKAKAPSKPPSAAAKKAAKAKVSEGTRLYPRAVKAASITEAEAMAFLPQGASVFRSRLDNRWRMSMGPHRISRCWTLHGELKAFAICARFLWSAHHVAGGEECPFAWIQATAEE